MSENTFVLEKWFRLTEEQIAAFKISTYKGEVILHDGSGICGMDTLFVNAQAFFEDSVLNTLPYWSGK